MLTVVSIFVVLVVLVALVVVFVFAESSRLSVGDDEHLESKNKLLKIEKTFSCRGFFNLISSISPRRVPISQCACDVCRNVNLCC